MMIAHFTLNDNINNPIKYVYDFDIKNGVINNNSL